MFSLFLAFWLTGPARAQQPALVGFGKAEFQALLQRFVDAQYLKSFRSLGVEEDFDHGHLLFDPRAPQRPIAILYHTQELQEDPAIGVQPRNWLQWVDRGDVEDASRYERRQYPATAYWDWFQLSELPALRRRRTILDKMLDPALLGHEVSPESLQWVFTKTACEGDVIRIDLPGGGPVCLSLDQT